MTQVCKTINLIDPNFKVVTLYPGDTIPEWAIGKVTNPAVLAKGSAPAVIPQPIVPPANTEVQVEVEPIDYDKLDKKGLIALCSERELATDGNKPDLIARLQEADKAPAGEEELDLFALDEDELKALAAERGVDLGGAATAVEMATVIEQAAE